MKCVDGSQIGQSQDHEKGICNIELVDPSPAWCLQSSNDFRKGKHMAKLSIAHSNPSFDESNSGQSKALLAHLAELSSQDG